jgi:hypothetical protein
MDEIDDPFDIQLIDLGNAPLAMHFKLTDTGDLELEELNGSADECFSRALPRIYAARGEMYDAKVRLDSDQWKERMRKAVEDERAREYPCNAEKAGERAFGYDKYADDENVG